VLLASGLKEVLPLFGQSTLAKKYFLQYFMSSGLVFLGRNAGVRFPLLIPRSQHHLNHGQRSTKKRIPTSQKQSAQAQSHHDVAFVDMRLSPFDRITKPTNSKRNKERDSSR